MAQKKRTDIDWYKIAIEAKLTTGKCGDMFSYKRYANVCHYIAVSLIAVRAVYLILIAGSVSRRRGVPDIDTVWVVVASNGDVVTRKLILQLYGYLWAHAVSLSFNRTGNCGHTPLTHHSVVRVHVGTRSAHYNL